MLDVIRQLVAWLWWGPLRRLFRGILHRLFGEKQEGTILLGPLRGRTFHGALPYLLGIYEIPVERAIRKHLHPGSVFYDIGANYGYFSLLGAVICGADGHVFSFEPVPDNVQRIRQNTMGVDNCTVIAKAVSSESGIARMAIADGVRSSLCGHQDGAITVALVTLDEFAKYNRLPDLVKVDVEGAEQEVIAGARSLLSRPDAPVFIIELHDQDSDRKIKAELTERGFTLLPLTDPLRRRREYPRHILAQKRGGYSV